jgi:16S rRNA (guanine527-N7)-methyltransferase
LEELYINDFLEKLSINDQKKKTIQRYIDILKEENQHTNLVGKSTLQNPWLSHILDSLQILFFVNDKKLSLLDMGTGAGFPGSILSIAGFENVTLMDSNGKKITFLKNIKKRLDLNTNIVLGRIESVKDKKYDIITSRALANLNKLLSYSQNFIKKNTVLIFLKGKTVNEEITEALKKWDFDHATHQSISDTRGKILIINNIKKK